MKEFKKELWYKYKQENQACLKNIMMSSMGWVLLSLHEHNIVWIDNTMLVLWPSLYSNLLPPPVNFYTSCLQNQMNKLPLVTLLMTMTTKPLWSHIHICSRKSMVYCTVATRFLPLPFWVPAMLDINELDSL